MIDIKKIIVRIFIGLVVLGVFAYIFWPQNSQTDTSVESTTIPETTINISTTTTDITTTTINIVDPPCLVLYQKDSDQTSLSETPCINTYVQKYLNKYYTKLFIVCRSSGDGNVVNRENLSLDRMKSLQFNLMQKGVSYEDIDAQSLGDKSPYPGVDPSSDDGKIINRSCEITGLTS